MKKSTKDLLREARERARAELYAKGWRGPGHSLTVRIKVKGVSK